MSAVSERVQRVLAPAVEAEGLDLEAVDVQPAGRRRLVRVVVDKDGGITLDDVAELSHRLSQLLDDSEAMGDQPFTLEVTSPGVDRPLTLPRHWRRNVGRLVAVTLCDGDAVAGRLIGADATSATLEVEGAPRQVTLDAVATAQVEVEFRRPAGGE